MLLHVLALLLGAQPAPALQRQELELKQTIVALSRQEISGAAKVGSDFYVVADKPEDHFIYRATWQKNRVSLTPAIDLTQLKGYMAVQKAMSREDRVAVADRRFDLEGLAACGDTFYLINERVRQVYKITGRASVEVLHIDFSGYAPLFAGGANAGFEGIAADCEQGRLFVAKEREPRQLFTVDLKSGSVTAADFPPSDRAEQKVINPFTGEGLLTIAPDISDLAYDGGYLYALERNTYEVAKLDPKTFAVLGRASYLKSEKPLYETGEPFGLAEALVLTQDEIWLGLDHNQAPLSGHSEKALGISGPFGLFLVFKRPPGF